MAKTVAISPDVADVLSRATVVGGNTVVLPPGQLDRDLYVAVDKVLKALGGKWTKGKGHVFALGLGDQLEQALAAGKATDLKRTHEQFFTPPDLAQRVVDLARILPGMKVLEPSAGDGALVGPIVAAGGIVWAYEIDERLRHALLAKFYSQFGAGGLGVDFDKAPNAACPGFNRVVMNPPFSKGQDADHVTKVWGMLMPGGVLVAIMGEHAFTASDRRSVAFREFLADIDATVEIVPPGAFKASGTMVGTRIICATKPE